MFLVRKPSALGQFLATQQTLDFTYTGIGATATTPPAGYVVDRTRIQLGKGGRTFHAAKQALEQWLHFRLGWVEAWPPPKIQPGRVVAVLAHVFGFWCLNACRIVYVVDDQGPVPQFGFAYGTLPEHAESGEEQFCVSWDTNNDLVWYDILAFSRPQQFLVRLGYPIVRRLQKRFAKDSAAAMVKAVMNA